MQNIGKKVKRYEYIHRFNEGYKIIRPKPESEADRVSDHFQQYANIQMMDPEEHRANVLKHLGAKHRRCRAEENI